MFDLKTKILAVEDAESIRVMMVKSLNELGFLDIIQAENGKIGFDLLMNEKPKVGLILSDWNMPVCNGLEFLKLVRATPGFDEIPFVMVTSNDELKHTLTAVKEGVSNFIVKPFTTKVLREKLKAISNKRLD